MKAKITPILVLIALAVTVAVASAEDVRTSSKIWLRPAQALRSGNAQAGPEVPIAAISSKPWLYPEQEVNVALLPAAPATASLRAKPVSNEGSPVNPATGTKAWLHKAS